MRRGLGIAVALALVGIPLGWGVSDRLERDNDFCNACHLAPDLPLHVELRGDFDARPAASLAAAHGRERDFRCIDCHGGTRLVGRARVKLLAAKDAFWYVAGHFEEPDGMRWPLWDEDCLKCHGSFEERSDAAEWGTPRFHELSVHNVELGVACVSCHLVHDPGGRDDTHFIHAEPVRAECARCHPEFDATL